MGGDVFGKTVTAVAGVTGAVGSLVGSKRQSQAMNQMAQQGQQYDARTRGLMEYFLGGGKASQLKVPGFSDQFARLDYVAQEQARAVDNEARKTQQLIADSVPDGGAKLRMLAELAQKTQEQKGQIMRETAQRKRDLDVELTNQYLKAATAYKAGPGYDVQYANAAQQYGEYGKAAAGLGQALGQLTQLGSEDKKKEEVVKYYPPRAPSEVKVTDNKDLLDDVWQYKDSAYGIE